MTVKHTVHASGAYFVLKTVSYLFCYFHLTNCFVWAAAGVKTEYATVKAVKTHVTPDLLKKEGAHSGSQDFHAVPLI